MVLALLASGGHADRQQTCLPSARHLTELRSARLLACFAHLAREVTYALDAGDGPLALLLKLGLGSAFSLARSVTTLAASTVASRRRKLERVLDDILAAPTVCDLARDIQSRVRRARDHSVFKAGRIAKTYWAVVEGRPEADAGTIDLALGRRAATRGWWMCVDPAGQAATTEWRVLGRGAGRSWLELKPLTGRTHQIRVHCTARGWPLIGDAIYGSRTRPTRCTCWPGTSPFRSIRSAPRSRSRSRRRCRPTCIRRWPGSAGRRRSDRRHVGPRWPPASHRSYPQ